MVMYVKSAKYSPATTPSHPRCAISLLKSIHIISILILIHVMIIVAFHLKKSRIIVQYKEM